MKLRIIAFVLLAMCLGTGAIADEVVLITNLANPDKVIPARDAKNIFLGKKSTWSDGTPIVSYTLADVAVTEEFAKTFVKKSAQQFSNFWRKAIFTGKGTPPENLPDSEQMKDAIASKKGAIGYILKSKLDSSVTRLQLQ